MYRNNNNNNAQRTIPGGTSCREIINTLPQNAETLSRRAIFGIFDRFKNEYMTKQDMLHPKFQSFLERTQFFIPQMNAHELSNIAMSIMNNKLLKQHDVTDQIQDTLILRIEQLSFDRIMVLGIIIRKTESSLEFESIHVKIRVIFLENAKRLLSSHNSNNIHSLVNIAGYMTRNTEYVQTDILEAFSIALLRADKRELEIHEAVTIILLFSKFVKLSHHPKNALNDMVNFWIENNPRLTDIEDMCSHLSRNEKCFKSAFEESGLIRFISTVLDESSGEVAIQCFVHLMKMGYWRKGIHGIMRCDSTLHPNTLDAFFVGLRKGNNIKEKDVRDPTFQRFLKETETLLPQMDASQLSNIANGILNNELLQQQKFIHKIKDALILKVHELPLVQMLIVDFNIKKSKLADFYQQIHSKIQEIFLKNVENFLLADHKKYIPGFLDIARYLGNYRNIVDMNIIEAFSVALLRAKKRPLDIDNLVTIFLVYSNYGELGAQSIKALNELVKLWIKSNPTLDDVETLLYQISKARARLDKEAFEESGIIQYSLTFLSKECNEKVISSYEHLMRMGYWREGIQGIARCSNTPCGGNLFKFPQSSNTLKLKSVHAFFTGLLQTGSVTEEDIQHPEFQSFLHSLSSIISQMNAFQLSDVAFAIMKHNALLEHGFSGEVCNAMLLKLQDLSIERMLKLDFRMRRSKSSSTFSENIQKKIQEIFFEKFEHLFSGRNDDEFYNIATYISDNSHIIPMNIFKRFSCALLHLDEHRITILDVTVTIKLFSQFNELDEQSRNGLNKMVKLWIDFEPTARDVKQLFAFISGSRQIDKLAFEESGLIRYTLNYLDENCDYETVSCYGHLLKMGYWRESIDALSKLLTEKAIELDVHTIIQMCCACQKYNYKPSNWKQSIFPALQSFDFSSHIDAIENFSWPGFALKLHSLGHCDTVLIEAVLGSTKFKDSIYIDSLQEISMNKSSNDNNADLPKTIQLKTLIKNLEEVFGTENILIDHRVDEQYTIPFVLLMNSETNEFLPIAWNWLDIRPNEELIGINVAKEDEDDCDLKPTESDGNRFKFVNLNPSLWLRLPESDRKAFLFEKIDDVINSEK